MKYKKIMFMLVLAVFLLSITCVSASEIDDTLASEDTNTIGLSVDKDIIEDNLQTSEENDELTLTDNDVLDADSATYSDLDSEIRASGNVTLTHKNYIYDDGAPAITISEANKVIDGNGAVIDMTGSTIRAFTVSASGVTIKNLTIKNASYNGNGGAIYFSSSGTVTNCNFTNNTASDSGGAIFFAYSDNPSTVTNCNFTDNEAYYGGAIIFYYSSTGTVTNCNFTNNKATGDNSWGGAILMASGTVTNCNFTNNKATGDNSWGGAVYFDEEGTVTNCNFTANQAFGSGGAVYFDRGGIVTNCNFTNNTATNGNGGAIRMSSGSVTNCNFTNNTATNGDGGAIWMYSGSVENCNFTNNTATNGNGGAIRMSSGSVTNCNFTANQAFGSGGAVYFDRGGIVTNCNFTGNNATTGSAIYFYRESSTKTISNSCFLNNRANAEILEVLKNDDNITITFKGNDNLLNAIYSKGDVSFTNVTYWSANGIANTGSSTPARSNKEAGQNITVGVIVNDIIVLTGVYLTNENGTIVLDIKAGENYFIGARHDTDSYYTEKVNITSNNTKFHVNVTSQTSNNRTVNITAKSNIPDEVMKGKLLFILQNGTEINATYAAGGIWWAVHTFEGCGVYQVNASYDGLNNVTVNKGTIAVTAPEHTFWFLNYTINGNDKAEINLTNDYYYDSAYDEAFAEGIVINRKVTINGNGYTIDAKGKARVFNVQADDVTIENLTIKNANYNGDGGAVYFAKSGRAINCNFAENKAIGDDSQGGAIYFSSKGTVKNCNFTNNTASKDGGAVYLETDGTATGCIFNTNQARSGRGGAIYFSQGSSTVADCVFISNSAGNFSAVHLSSGVGNVSGCLFINNSAEFGVVGQAWDSYNQMHVNNNIFLNNDVTTDVIDFADIGIINTDYNWFGNTQDNYKEGVPSQTSNIWLFLNATANPNPITVTDSSKIVFKLYAYNTSGDVSNYSSNLPKPVNLTITKTKGDVDKSIVNFDDEIVFYPASAGTGSVTASVENIAYTIKINIKGNPELSVDPQDVYYSNNTVISLNYNSTATGKVNITLKGKKFDYTFEDLTLNATVSLGKVNPDEYNVTVTYSGDDTFLNATAKGNLTVTPIVDISITITVDKDEYFVGDIVVWTLTVHNAGNGTNATDVYVDNNFPGDYFEMINATTDNGTYHKHIGNEYWWEIGFMANATDATLKIFSQAKVAKNDIPNFAKAFAKEDDWNYTNNLAQKDVSVKKINSTLNVTDTVLDYGQTANITVTTEGATDITANIITQKGNVIEAEVNGFTVMIPVLDAGNHTLNVTTKADANHNPVTKTANITVNKANTEIKIDNPTGEMSAGSMAHVAAELNPSKAGNLTYTSNDTSVVNVSSTGVIQANKAGTALITVSFAGNNNYAAAENKTITITVNLKDASVSVNNSTLELFVNDNFTIVATTDPLGLNVSFVPDDSGVYSVDNDGVVTALREGTGTILVKVGDGKVYAENSTTVTVSVSKIPTEITIDSSLLDLFVGDETVIAAALTPAGAGNVTFTSSDDSVVIVDDQGNVIANGKGQTIITVSFAGDNKYAPAENKTITVTVSLNDASVTVDNNTLDLKVGETYAINATKHPDTILLDITYTSSNSSVASVDEKGIVTAVGEGTATITVEVGDGEIYAKNSTTVTVTVAANKIASEIESSAVTTVYNSGVNLIVTLKDANGNPISDVNITVDLNGAKTYTTDKNGQVKVSTKGLAPKTYTANITFNGTAGYEKSAKVVNVTIKKATPKITAKAKTFKTTAKNKKYTITLKDNNGKPIKKATVYLKVAGKKYKATTNSKGKATFNLKKLTKNGKYKAVITYKGNKNYKKVTKKAKITVKTAFKTVSRGSKDAEMVKKIQRALKNNGYYLSYNGHYLMVDGIFEIYTEMAVKDFQADHGLKVTGKVDEKTAKKLKII